MPTPTKPASQATAAANRAALSALAFDDDRDFADVRRGLIAPLADNGVIRDAAGGLVWDLAWFSFLQDGDAAPDSVHPSLWRQSQLISEAETAWGAVVDILDRCLAVAQLRMAQPAFEPLRAAVRRFAIEHQRQPFGRAKILCLILCL